jgi:hypothetical protein
LFSACKPDFELNAPYKDITVVYGILDHNSDTTFVKIYKGFQSRDGQTYINAQNPDSIYYYNKIIVVLEEYINGKRTARPDIVLGYTSNFKRDPGFFYADSAGTDIKKQIIYYTTEPVSPDAEYKIVITHRDTKKVTSAMTPVVGDFMIRSSGQYVMTANANRVDFQAAKNAYDYEIHVNFLYFEVDKQTNQIVEKKVVKNITPHLGEENWGDGSNLVKKFTQTFYDDIAAQLEPNPLVKRFIGTPASATCIEIEAWAGEKNIIKFVLSNKPTSSFIQVNTFYTNMETDDNMAFGFFSSRSQAISIILQTNKASQDSIVFGSKTRHLGFRYWEDSL